MSNHLFRRPGTRPLVACLGLGVALVAAIALWQDKMIYHPRPYPPQAESAARRSLQRLSYEIPSGRQVAFYLPPASGAAPEKLWVMFGGNGGLILEYLALPQQAALVDDGILMIDYPGYGYNAGLATGSAILPAANAAVAALAEAVDLPANALLSRAGVMGHSMGTGAALEFATAHPEVTRIMLVAPYTSLLAMCTKVVGPIALLLNHDFDNEAALATLGSRLPRPQVSIVTGDKDQVIPVSMSRKLAAEFPWLRYTELPGLEHNHIVTDAAATIAGQMRKMDTAKSEETEKRP